MLKCSNVSINSSRFRRNLKLKGLTSNGNNKSRLKVGCTLSTEVYISNGNEFITTWNLDDSQTIVLPLGVSGTYNFTVDWGDGSTQQITDSSQGTHTYIGGISNIIITINGTINGWSFITVPTSKNQITAVNNFGNLILLSGSFYDCENLQYCNGVPTLSSNISVSFAGCNKLTSINNILNWDTSQVTNISGMFNSCFNLTSLDISGWDTSKVTNMSYMFNICVSLSSFDISGWDTSKVKNMFSMFFSCYALKYVTGFGTRNYTSIINTGSSGFKGTFAQSGLSVNGYNQILIDLSNNVNLPPNSVQFGAVGVKYSSIAITARAYLTGIKGWTINDGGLA